MADPEKPTRISEIKPTPVASPEEFARQLAEIQAKAMPPPKPFVLGGERPQVSKAPPPIKPLNASREGEKGDRGGAEAPRDPPSNPPSSRNGNPDSHSWGNASDLAVAALCEVVALIFGFPLGDDLYHGVPITTRKFVFGGIAVIFAVAGPFWPTLRKRLPRSLSASVIRTASRFPVWLFVLFGLFAVTIGPDLYRRTTNAPEHGPSGSASFRNLPTSSAGLPPGTAWNNGGVISVTPETVPDPRDARIASLKQQLADLKAPALQSHPSTIVDPSRSPILGLDDAKRFQMVKGLTDSAVNHSGEHIRCRAIMAIEHETKWGEGVWGELSPILGYSRWDLEQVPRTASLFQPGIAISVASDSGDGFTCGYALSQVLSVGRHSAGFPHKAGKPLSY